ncbi:hypothetical protein JHW43_005009 [Diplocarpon mali]|nr:hypothetical protein JHW43_005009 [Diplocarpon mali]
MLGSSDIARETSRCQLLPPWPTQRERAVPTACLACRNIGPDRSSVPGERGLMEPSSRSAYEPSAMDTSPRCQAILPIQVERSPRRIRAISHPNQDPKAAFETPTLLCSDFLRTRIWKSPRLIRARRHLDEHPRAALETPTPRVPVGFPLPAARFRPVVAERSGYMPPSLDHRLGMLGGRCESMVSAGVMCQVEGGEE